MGVYLSMVKAVKFFYTANPPARFHQKLGGLVFMKSHELGNTFCTVGKKWGKQYGECWYCAYPMPCWHFFRLLTLISDQEGRKITKKEIANFRWGGNYLAKEFSQHSSPYIMPSEILRRGSVYMKPGYDRTRCPVCDKKFVAHFYE